MLTDNLFKPFSRMSTAPGVNAIPRAEPVCVPFFTNCSTNSHTDPHLVVSMVSLRRGTRRTGGFGHQCDSAGRDDRLATGNIPDQDGGDKVIAFQLSRFAPGRGISV